MLEKTELEEKKEMIFIAEIETNTFAELYEQIQDGGYNSFLSKVGT